MGKSVQNLCKIFDSIENMWNVFGIMWKIYGKSAEHMWKIYGKSVEIY